MKGHRTPYLETRTKTVKGKTVKERFWKAAIFSPAKNTYTKRRLFPLNHPHCKNPQLADRKLQVAWRNVKEGKKPPTAVQAVLRAEELAEELLRGGGALPEAVSVAKLVELELASPGKSGKRKPATLLCVRRELNRFDSFVDAKFPAIAHNIRHVRRAHIHAFVDHLRASGLGVGTIRNALAYVKRAFQMAVERELLEVNPCTAVCVQRAPTIGEQRRRVQEVALTEEQCEQLLEAARTPYRKKGRVLKDGTRKVNDKETHPPLWLYPFLLAAIDTGCRVGELLTRGLKDTTTGKEVHRSRGLRWGDIHWKRNAISVEGKTGADTVPLTPRLAEALKELRRKQVAAGFEFDYVFTNDNGKPLENPHKVLERLVKRAGLNRHLHPHQLRHTALTLYSNSPHVSPAVVQRIARHSTPAMTAKYIHTDEETMVQAALKAKSGGEVVPKVVPGSSGA